jgi:O-antigen biosynthesis protein
MFPMQSTFDPFAFEMFGQPPQRLSRYSAWNEHVPFAMVLIEALRPRAIVELGTHWGISYCAFCQAMQYLRVAGRCHAVDNWEGDTDAGFYGQEVYDDLKKHHRRYTGFSQLMRMDFNAAAKTFDNGAVDLLHIDGLHSYEAVNNDYQTWLPKMSDRGVILFHDVAVKDRGFGVWKLWDELTAKYPNNQFLFDHGYGLGVLGVGKDQAAPMRGLFEAPEAQRVQWKAMFSAMGRGLQKHVDRAAQEADARAANRTPVEKAVHSLRQGVRRVKRAFAPARSVTG